MEWNGLDWSLTESLVVSLYVTFDVTALDSHYSVWSGTVLGAISFDMTSCGPPWMWHHNHKGFFNSCFFTAYFHSMALLDSGKELLAVLSSLISKEQGKSSFA